MEDGTPLEYSKEWLSSKRSGDSLAMVILCRDEMEEIRNQMIYAQEAFLREVVFHYLPDLPPLLEEQKVSVNVKLCFHDDIGTLQIERR